MIKCVIFDVGGVLIKDNAEIVYERLNKRIGKTIFAMDRLSLKVLKGQISEKEYFNCLSKKSGIGPLKLDKMRTDTILKYSKTNKETIALAKILRRQHRIAILSNMSPMNKKILSGRCKFHLFSPRIFSCDMGFVKPQKNIYRLALKRVKLRPDECIFIDDQKVNLVYPKKMGMKTVHFRNANQLKKDLKKLGVKA